MWGVTVDAQATSGPSREVGLREWKKQRTKAELEAAALRLFSSRGFDNVTVEDIAKAADVSARTFFRHFGSKDDLVLSEYRAGVERLREQLALRPASESALTAVRLAIVAIAEEYERQRDAVFLRARLMADTPSLVGRSLEIQQQWEHAIADAVATRLAVAVENDLRPALVGACAVAALRVASNAWLADEGRRHLPSLVDAALLLIAGTADPTRWASAEGLQPSTTVA